MAKFPGFPVFDTADRLSEQADLGGYKTILSRLSELPMGQDSLERDLILSLQYLQDYAGTPGTYNRFRGEVQRFLNYLWVIAKRTLDQVDSEVVASYFKFLKTPPGAWVAPNIASGFANQGGERVINPKWRPFTRQRSRGPLYSASPASLKSSRVALSSYFRFLMARRVILEDPFLQVRKRETKAKSGYLLEQPEASVRRYTDWQWAYIRETVETAADQNSRYERHLFVIITMKSLFLRVSELAVRSIDGEPRLPTFGDYQKRVFKDSSYWTFYVFGKGEKGRTITCPNAYMSYLKRWRKHLCSDTPLPLPIDATPILPSMRGGGLGARQVERTCEEALMLAVERMSTEGLESESMQLKAIASETHYLRHTGASMAIEAGIDIRHVSEELGHASAAFTEAIYINSDQTRRRLASRDRSI